jgi:acyl-CoA hydrolase
MLVRAEVVAEDPATGRKVHTGSCVLTYVALDREGRPVPVPGLIAETPEEQARMEEGKRLYERAKEERKRGERTEAT